MNAPILRTTAQLAAEGWTDHRVAKAVAEGELVRVARGVFRWAGDLAPREAHIARVRAIMSRQGSVVASHASAAVIHGLVIHGAVPELVHLTVAPPARVRKRSGYHVHVVPLTAEDVIEVDGVRVTSLARTAADLARTAEFAWAVAAADQALRRRALRLGGRIDQPRDHPAGRPPQAGAAVRGGRTRGLGGLLRLRLARPGDGGRDGR
ncbi:MAG TPA: hypothetical protein GXZ45_15470 [Propionibacterium sp.]|nr:hypothetical protein [Propionibacterium sp.]